MEIDLFNVLINLSGMNRPVCRYQFYY